MISHDIFFVVVLCGNYVKQCFPIFYLATYQRLCLSNKLCSFHILSLSSLHSSNFFSSHLLQDFWKTQRNRDRGAGVPKVKRNNWTLACRVVQDHGQLQTDLPPPAHSKVRITDSQEETLLLLLGNQSALVIKFLLFVCCQNSSYSQVHIISFKCQPHRKIRSWLNLSGLVRNLDSTLWWGHDKLGYGIQKGEKKFWSPGP